MMAAPAAPASSWRTRKPAWCAGVFMLWGWSPGIGDPTPLGWLTVFAYAAAAAACFAVWRIGIDRREKLIWQYLFIALVLLGINKQLDLQTLFTDVGRAEAKSYNWYDNRRVVQEDFIFIITLGAILLAAVFLRYAARLDYMVKIALFGFCFILVFVLARASSFHHIDEFLGRRLLGWKMNWLLELGGIGVILVAACGRYRSIRSAAGTSRARIRRRTR